MSLCVTGLSLSLSFERATFFSSLLARNFFILSLFIFFHFLLPHYNFCCCCCRSFVRSLLFKKWRKQTGCKVKINGKRICYFVRWGIFFALLSLPLHFPRSLFRFLFFVDLFGWLSSGSCCFCMSRELRACDVIPYFLANHFLERLLNIFFQNDGSNFI